MEKHFINIERKRFLPATTQNALFWPKLLPAFFLVLDIHALLKSWQKRTKF
jgi:hypothetical protein